LENKIFFHKKEIFPYITFHKFLKICNIYFLFQAVREKQKLISINILFRFFSLSTIFFLLITILPIEDIKERKLYLNIFRLPLLPIFEFLTRKILAILISVICYLFLNLQNQLIN